MEFARPSRPLALVALLLGLLGTAQAAPGAGLRYRVQDLGVIGPPDTSATVAYGINNHGVVVGYASAEWGNEDQRAFRWHAGRFELLGTRGRLTTSIGWDINERGDVAGLTSTPPSYSPYTALPFAYRDGRLDRLGLAPIPGRGAFAKAINESGMIAGAVGSRAFVHDGQALHYVPLEDARSSWINGLNNLGVAAGRMTEAATGQVRAFLYDGTRVTYLPSPVPDLIFIEPEDINDAGQVLMVSSDGTFLYVSGGYQRLNTPALESVYGTALNERGWVVGNARAWSGPFHAFLWRDGRMQDLNTLLTANAQRDWTLTEAYDINDRGQIVGVGLINGLSRSFLATPVPEPGTWALLLAGLGGLAAVVRRDGAKGCART